MLDLDVVTADGQSSSRCEPAECGKYVTNGSRLFRVVAPIDRSMGLKDAVLEDCSTLAWQVYSWSELWRLRLHEVGAATGA